MAEVRCRFALDQLAAAMDAPLPCSTFSITSCTPRLLPPAGATPHVPYPAVLQAGPGAEEWAAAVAAAERLGEGGSELLGELHRLPCFLVMEYVAGAPLFASPAAFEVRGWGVRGRRGVTQGGWGRWGGLDAAGRIMVTTHPGVNQVAARHHVGRWCFGWVGWGEKHQQQDPVGVLCFSLPKRLYVSEHCRFQWLGLTSAAVVQRMCSHLPPRPPRAARWRAPVRSWGGCCCWTCCWAMQTGCPSLTWAGGGTRATFCMRAQVRGLGEGRGGCSEARDG
jgi:hypothetical protein